MPDHAHSHGVGSTAGGVREEASLVASERGIWAVKWSLAGLMVTAVIQVGIVALTGSVGLLADTVHNFGDAMTAVPLWIAFRLFQMKPTRRFTYGYGRAEDLAGLIVVLIILASGVFSGYKSIQRFFDPREIGYLGALAAAGVVGFIGNEAVAVFRIKVGRSIGSAALVADGHHAQVDGLTSLAVVLGAAGVWLGYPLADPIVGILISIAIFHIVWEAGGMVITRLIDGVDPEITGEIRETAMQTPGVKDVAEVRVRWIGHMLHAELNIAVEPGLSVVDGHSIAARVQDHLLDHLEYLRHATIHVDPLTASGEDYHLAPGPAPPENAPGGTGGPANG